MSGRQAPDGSPDGGPDDRADDFYAALLEDDAEELYQNAPCAYLSTAPDGTIVKANATFFAWAGLDPDDVIGKRQFQDLLPPGDRIFYETHVSPSLRMQGHVREIAVELVCRGGDRLPVLVNAALKSDGDGNPIVIRTVMFDARERRAYELELLAARRRAEEMEAHTTALVRTLRASFVPGHIGRVPGVDIAGAYRPGGDGSEVGGDFYDVFETPEGRWAVVIGDVIGKGPEAAVLTALARHTVRAEALHSSEPGVVLAGLHDALLQYHPDRFCAAVFMTLETTTDGVRACASTGGHPLPLLARSNGTIGPIGAPGPIVGMIDSPARAETEVDLAPGDVVVLHTDGVSEARRGGELFGDDRISAIVAERSGEDARAIADALVGAALEFQGGDTRDDIAVVVIKVEPPTPGK